MQLIALCLSAAMVSLSGLLFGYSTASIAGSLAQIEADLTLDILGQQVLVASVPAACFIGAIAAGPSSARLGRRLVLLIAFSLAAVGNIIALSAPGYELLVAARMLVGIAVGLSSMIAPMYGAEITPARYRGTVVASFQLAVTAGILAAYATPLLLPGQQSWSLILGIGIVPSMVGLVVVALLPESPRWLLGRNRTDDARRAAERLVLELNVAEMSPMGDDVPKAALMATIRRGSTMAVLILCSFLFVLQNLSGIDGILYYAPHIFEQLGFTEGTSALAATFGLGLLNFLATVVALWMVDRAGRRPLMLVGSAFMVAGLALVIVSSVFGLPTLGLIGLGLYIVAFAVSLGPLPFVLMSELFPSTIREAGIATASATSWLFNMLVAFTFLSLVELMGLAGVIGLFMAMCVIAFVIGLFFVPETKGRSLEAIEDDVLGGTPLRRVGDGTRPLSPEAARSDAL
ncbi:sugar porter family MFS transporter [Amorphus orientalis]|uniref:SP family galactose:H+ symporter-like MFS transporter n=1 Tax=Amorphus orientalis TaxID=649198 RepID=A0AAE3VTN0_9HYPH|nr:sugar porter family MFS transporter [Amorphus orientalis]MDQ0317620.1 SP family galactose:H+ symporter-like MFS transporter [Amorphus orientalis]